MGGGEAFALDVPFADAVRDFQRDYMLAALTAHRGGMAKAAAAVGVCAESFRKYLQDCGVDYRALGADLRAGADAERKAFLARRAENTRRCKLRKAGKPLDTPKRVAKSPREKRIVPVLKAQGKRGPKRDVLVTDMDRAARGGQILAPRVPVRVDELGWAEGD